MTEKTGLKILLIDDEGEFASTLAERLNLRGYSASVVLDGESALERVKEEPFDLALLDVMLPGMHGIEVLRRLRDLKPDLPVILLTGQAGAKDGIEGMKQGAKGYLNKPVDLRELLAMFAELFPGGGNA